MAYAARDLSEVVEYDTNGGCWLWNRAPNGHGYGQIKQPDGRRLMAHRISFEQHNGPIPDGVCVLHRCDVRACINPAHLFLGDKSDNAKDAVRKGRWVNNRGERHGMSKLSDEQINTIRKRLLGGVRQVDIAVEFGVSQTAICNINTGRRRAK